MKPIRVVTFVAALFWTMATADPAAQGTTQANAALRYWMAFAQLSEAPGTAAAAGGGDLGERLSRVESGAEPWNEPVLGPLMDANAAALDTMMRASRIAACDWGLEHELGPTAPVAHLPKARALSRLNTLAGLRAMSQGRADAAVQRWLAGMRFAQHIERGGPLISTLSGWAALRSTWGAVQRTSGLNVTQRAQLRSAVEAIPETAFDWGAALRNERQSIEVALMRLRTDPQAAQVFFGGQVPGGPSLPTATETSAFGRYMDRVVSALRQSPEQAAPALERLEKEKTSLHGFFAALIPSVTRINDNRRDVKAARERILTALK